MTDRRLSALVLAAAVAVGSGCASTAVSNPDDPWEGLNRGTHGFNEGLDKWLIAPVATGWDWLAPEIVETGVRNFFDNALDTPRTFLNDLLQLKMRSTAEDFARFCVNTTAGLAGILDVATIMDIPRNNEDFGQTLGYWGTPPGPYVVLPVFGPSNPRDAVGLAVDVVSSPWGWIVPWFVTIPARTGDIINTRALYLEEVAENRRTSFDYYVFLRNAYTQNRAKEVRDHAVFPDEQESDLYYFDEEEAEAEDEEAGGEDE